VSIHAIFFDVGETLVDEERAWRVVAEAAGVAPHALWAALGVTIERGLEHHAVWELVGRVPPGQVAELYALAPRDLYPDAIPCLERCRAAGLVVGIAGNQPASAEAMLREADAPADVVASSASWGVAKPDPAFFARIVEETGLLPAEIAYVGDRVDNDVVPAAAAGMVAVHLRRGPWGLLQDAAGAAALVLDDLRGVPEALASLG
jgi:HAD superfamily hydrolase (TIGR01549 family)